MVVLPCVYKPCPGIMPTAFLFSDLSVGSDFSPKVYIDSQSVCGPSSTFLGLARSMITVLICLAMSRLTYSLDGVCMLLSFLRVGNYRPPSIPKTFSPESLTSKLPLL